MEHLLVHRATHYRAVSPGSEYGTPEPAVLTVIGSFKCRLSWEGGFETASARSGQREQTRSGRVFALYSDVSIQRGDRLVFQHVSGTFEVEFHRVIWDSTAPHHWEVDVVFVEGT